MGRANPYLDVFIRLDRGSTCHASHIAITKKRKARKQGYAGFRPYVKIRVGKQSQCGFMIWEDCVSDIVEFEFIIL